jgi:branched-chain amino acid aminotransferase
MKIWLNDRITDESEVALDTDGWPQGIGIFETLRTEDGEVFELSRHMRRAIGASESTGIKLPSEELIRSAVATLLSEDPHKIGRLRLMFSNNLFVAIHRSYADVQTPLKICTQTQLMKSDQVSIKKYPYTERLALLAAVAQQGYDEIICNNSKNQVTEGAVSNFLFLIDRLWFTTPLTAGVLPGVMRAISIERCGVKVRNIGIEEIARAESALVVSSLKIALPVASIDGRALKIGSHAKTLEEEIRSKTQKHSVG